METELIAEHILEVDSISHIKVCFQVLESTTASCESRGNCVKSDKGPEVMSLKKVSTGVEA